jgi:hypothetical protein
MRGMEQIFLGVCLVLVVLGSGCMGGQPEEPGISDADYSTPLDPQDIERQIGGYPLGTLTEEEQADMLYLAEEEKMARDVYRALYDNWGHVLFAHIGAAEQTHMDSIGVLINRYGLESPIREEAGAFTNAELQVLYYELVNRGSISRDGALKEGALIEEISIADLGEAIARTDNPDSIVVYEHLRRGSRNHLRAFVMYLWRDGVTYSPRRLTADEYAEIIAGPMEHGMMM